MPGIVGFSVSRSTVLRVVSPLPEPEPPTPRVVGVDEYATRKGRIYGTVLVDVETHRLVDMLPDREASSLAVWLTERPGVKVVCRGRAPSFAEGAATRASQAVQVADRWYLWHNLGKAAERSVAQHRECPRVLVPVPATRAAPEPTPPEEASVRLAVADRSPVRRPYPGQTRHSSRIAGSRPQSPIHRPPTTTHRTVKSLADAKTGLSCPGRRTVPPLSRSLTSPFHPSETDETIQSETTILLPVSGPDSFPRFFGTPFPHGFTDLGESWIYHFQKSLK
ncbi:transposase [Streptomyces sirii]|uniref:transposase n=1 Tax=Streptomyces sirii TaxID=3127701 RepID=UPI003D36ECF2